MAAATGIFVVVGCVATQVPTSNSGIWADPRVQKLIMKQELGHTHAASKLASAGSESLLIEDGSDVYFGNGPFAAQQRATVMVERQSPFDRKGAFSSRSPAVHVACSSHADCPFPQTRRSPRWRDMRVRKTWGLAERFATTKVRRTPSTRASDMQRWRKLECAGQSRRLMQTRLPFLCGTVFGRNGKGFLGCPGRRVPAAVRMLRNRQAPGNRICFTW